VNQLEVRADRLTLVLVILLGIFFVPMGVALLIGSGVAHAVVGLVCLTLSTKSGFETAESTCGALKFSSPMVRPHG